MKKLRKLTTLLVSMSFLTTSLFGNYTYVFAKNELSQELSSNIISLQKKVQDQDLKKPLSQTVFNNVYNVTTENKTDKKVVQKERKEILIKYKDETKAEKVKEGIKSKLKLSKLNIKNKVKNTKTELLEIDDNDDVDKFIEELKMNPNVQYV
ncbi:S8 family serine peptidase [Bacillus sp. 3255]|uniref:S8 family serine peptidase n=1 Tax=Bacillus sp. 3255 TaxID=2817904 RepID=UPI00285A1025|nr:hypothetical protein [Bacillus sp. 3255]MDR6880409.1 putative membrane protein YhiD involved in acid resistance [Bacillus sp. 3255]